MNYLQTDNKATIETRLVHDMHRRATSLLAESAAHQAAPSGPLTELRNFVVATLRHHHESEDEHLWPLIIDIAPDLAGAFSDLSREHDQLDRLLDALSACAVDDDSDRPDLTAAAVAVRDMVQGHLAREEPLLLPVLLTRLPDEAWQDFSQQTVASSPPEAAPLVIGFLDRVGTPDEIDVVLANLPDAAHALVPATRRDGRAFLDALEAAIS